MSTLGSLKLNLYQKPNSRERLIFFVALLAFAFVFFRSCVQPTRDAITDIQTQVEKANLEHTELQTRMNAAAQGIPQKARDKSRTSEINWIGSKASAGIASDTLVKSAQESGIVLVRFSLPDFKDKQNYLFKPVSLTLAGSLGDLNRYIENTETLNVPLVIEHLELSQTPEYPDLVTLRIEGGFYAER